MTKLSLVLLFVAACAAAAWLIIFKPYESSEYVRSTSDPVTVLATYINVTGDPLCSKLYVSSEDGEKKAIFPRLPTDIPDPHTKSSITEGDLVELKGYLYEWQTKNRITGSTRKRAVNMMDVIAWSSGDELRYETQLQDHSGSQFAGENYTSCLK